MDKFVIESERDESDPDTANLIRQFMGVTSAEPAQLLACYPAAERTAKTPADAVLACWPDTAFGAADHPRAWRLHGEVFLTIEPYLGNRENEVEGVAEVFERAGWRCVHLPRGYGMWAPPRSRLFLVAQPGSQADIEGARSLLLRRKAPYWRQSSRVDHSLAEMVAAELVNSAEE